MPYTMKILCSIKATFAFTVKKLIFKKTYTLWALPSYSTYYSVAVDTLLLLICIQKYFNDKRKTFFIILHQNILTNSCYQSRILVL